MKSVGVAIGAFLLVAGVFTTGTWTPLAFAKDTLEVVDDKDKTVYVIDSDDESRREEEKDKERAWKMLQNGNILIDGRERRPTSGSAGE